MSGILETISNMMYRGEAGSIPQNQQQSPEQVQNKAGGFVYKVDDLNRLRRFLCLGVEGGTYYVGEKELGEENAQCIQRLIAEGKGKEAVQVIVTFSVEGRAAKQNPIIFALAMCCRQSDDAEVKKAAYAAVADVCRIPTHLFNFVQYCEKLSRGTGWGRAHRRAIGNWYLRYKDDPKTLAVHVTKYKNRDGWTHTDVLRLAHPKPDSEGVAAVLKYVVKGFATARGDCLTDASSDTMKQLFEYLQAVEDIKERTAVDEVVDLIQKHNLVREHIPTNWLNEKDVWKALLQKMPLTALIRNLGKMTNIQLLAADSDEENLVVEKLGNANALKNARIHPFNVLVALCTYKSGKGDKGKLTWTPNNAIIKALDRAFYASFKFVEPTEKRYCLAVDVSGSMSCGGVNGSSSISPRDASAALAMVTARTEADYEMVGFSHTMVPLGINADMNLEQVIRVISSVPMGGTDCAQPMLWAKQNNKKFDVFIVYTDCETWAGHIHPDEALRQYRASSGIPDAKLIVCAMTAGSFTLADPNDPGMLDMAGFDSSGPEVMRNFVLGLL